MRRFRLEPGTGEPTAATARRPGVRPAGHSTAPFSDAGPRQRLAGIAALAGSMAIGVAQAGGSGLQHPGADDHVLRIDSHVDIPLDFASPTDDPTGFTSDQFDLPKMRAGGLDAVFLVLFAPQGAVDDAGFAAARSAVETRWQAIDRLVRSFPSQVGLATSADDVARIRRSGRLALLIGMENAYPLGLSVDDVGNWAARGVRYVGLTHAGDNQFASSSDPAPSPADPAARRGLTPLGVSLVRALNKAGVMVDVSHSDRETMLQAVAVSDAPVIASHSGARAVTDSPRNLDDAQLRALAARGGVAQMVAHPKYIGRPDPGRLAAIQEARARFGITDPAALAQMTPGQRADYDVAIAEVDRRFPRPTVSDFVDQIDHAVAVAGIDHVGIASDFGGGGGITGWADASETPAVTAELVRRGYGEEQIAKLWGGNLLRVMHEVERVSRRLRQR